MMTEKERFEKQRKAAIAEMRALVAKTDARGEDRMSREDGQRFQELETEVDKLTAKIGAVDPSAKELSARMAVSVPPPMPNINAGPADHRIAGDVWIDGEGRRVNVLSKGQSLTAAMRQRGETAPAYNMGDVVKYLAGVKVPSDIRAALGEGTGSSGQYLVNPYLSAEIIDKVRSKSQCFAAGMKTVEMPAPTLYLARLTTDPAVVWHAENTADLLAASPIFDRVGFAARTLGAVILMSKELIQDSTNLGDEITYALAKAMALEVDRAALLGDGSSNSPYGLAHIAGITSTAGAAVTDCSQFVSSIGRVMANSLFPTAIITSPQIVTKVNGLQNTLHDALRAPACMSRVPLLDTAKVPNTGSVSAAYTGDFTNLMLGIRAELELNVLKERFVEYGQVGIAAWYRCDVNVLHPEAFDIVTGLS